MLLGSSMLDVLLKLLAGNVAEVFDSVSLGVCMQVCALSNLYLSVLHCIVLLRLWLKRSST